MIPRDPSPPDAGALDDATLVSRVRAAAATRVVPETVERKVGEPATINTGTEDSLELLRRVHFQVDPDHPDETLALATATTVIYWVRPVAGHDPRAVGLQLRADGTATVFFVVIKPP